LCSCKNNHSLNAWGVATSNFQKSFVSLGGGNNLQILKKKIHYQKKYIFNRTELLEMLTATLFSIWVFFSQTPNSYFQMSKNQKQISPHISVSWLFLFSVKKKYCDKYFQTLP